MGLFASKFLVHARTYFLVEDLLVFVEGVAFVVARSEVPKHDDEVVGTLVSLDDGELGLVGLKQTERGEAHFCTEYFLGK